MKHTKTETRTVCHVVTLTAAEINRALLDYVVQKLRIAGQVRSSEPPYFQATQEANAHCIPPGQICGAINGGSSVQLVFETVDAGDPSRTVSM